MTFCMFELAKHPEIQPQLHEEIDQVLQQHNGKITYESISGMKYLDACIDETMRKYPIGSILNRTCVKDYKIPGIDIIIEKGVQVFIPTLGLHMDEKYYDEPEKFKPERFIDERSAEKIFMAFGDGPRNCIGIRLGKMQTKAGIVKSTRGMACDPKHFVLSPKDPVELRVIKRQKCKHG